MAKYGATPALMKFPYPPLKEPDMDDLKEAIALAEKMRTTISGSLAETLKWVSENKHHHGYWTSDEHFFVLAGNDAELRIPSAIHVPGMIEGDDYEETGRMYRLSETGRAYLRRS